MRTTTAMIASAAMLATGLWLLYTPAPGRPAATAPTSAATTSSAATARPIAVAPPSSLPSPQSEGTPVVSSASADAAPTSVTTSADTSEAGGLAPADGPAADPTIQAMLEHSVQADLPTALEGQLARLGRAVWLADITGAGRDQWPAYFTSPGSSGYTDVRVQAVIARRTATGTVTVTLLWAGTSPGGDVQVGLPGSLLLIHHPDGTWEPTR